MPAPSRATARRTLLAAIALHHLTHRRGRRRLLRRQPAESRRGSCSRPRSASHASSTTRTSSPGISSSAGAPTRDSRRRSPDICACSPPTRGCLHGLKPSLAIIDELHAHADDDVYLALRTAQLKVPGSKMIVISTAGAGRRQRRSAVSGPARSPSPTSPAKAPFTDARGPQPAPARMVAPEDANIDDPKVVKKCEPRLVDHADGLDASSARPCPSSRTAAYHCGPVDRARRGTGCRPAPGRRLRGKPEFTDGETVWVGVDVGGERSASAVVWVNASLHVGCGIFHGDEAVLDANDKVRELAGRYKLREVDLRPVASSANWRPGTRARGHHGDRVPTIRQPGWSPPANRLYAADRRAAKLTVPDHAELRQHAANTIARHGRRGWRLDKTSFTEPNDSVVALAMAFSALESHPQPVELLAWI